MLIGAGVTDSQMMVTTIAQPSAIPSARMAPILEERELSRVRGRRAEEAAVELGAPAASAVLVQAVLAARELEALGHQVGVVAEAGHARAEARIIVLPPAHLVDDADHVLRPLRVMGREPFLEEVLERSE